MTEKRRAFFELSGAMIIVGSSVVVGKLIVASFPVFLASGLRFAIASVILLALLMKMEKRFPTLNKKDLMILCLQAFTGVFGFSVFLLYGLKISSAAESGIILSTTPSVIGVISFLFLREKIVRNKINGIIFAVLGIIAINVIGSSATDDLGYNPLFGHLLIFGAVLGEALFTILGKVVSSRISPLAISTFVSLFGFLFFLPFAIYEALFFDFSKTTILDWGLIMYSAVFVTVIGFFLWYQGVSKVSGSTAAVFTGVLPVSALLLSYVILGEAFSWSHVIGVICVLIGIRSITKEQ
jgi:drug/metabolite transporter (DMT)-like permease